MFGLQRKYGANTKERGYEMTTVLIVIGIILGFLILVGIVILISDSLYYRKKEKEEQHNKTLEEDLE